MIFWWFLWLVKKHLKVFCFILHIYIILFFLRGFLKRHFEFMPNIYFCDYIYINTHTIYIVNTSINPIAYTHLNAWPPCQSMVMLDAAHYITIPLYGWPWIRLLFITTIVKFTFVFQISNIKKWVAPYWFSLIS